MAPTGTLYAMPETVTLDTWPAGHVVLTGSDEAIADTSAAVRSRHAPDTPYAKHRAQAMRELRSINRHARQRRR